MLSRHGEHLATRLEHRSLAVRRDVGVLDEIASPNLPRAQRAAIADHLHRHFAHRLAVEIEQIHPAPRLEDDLGRPDRREMHIVVLEGGHLPRLASVQIESPEIGAFALVAIGEEVDRRAVPHWKGIVGVVVG